MIRAYAIACYLTFLAVLVYLAGWLADAVVLKGIDDGARVPALPAALVDVALFGGFALQHSVMARPRFKRSTRVWVSVRAERATFVLCSSAALALLVWQWRPLDHNVWDVGEAGWHVLLWAGYGAGWLIVVLSSFMIGHFELFGLKQALRRGRYAEPEFGTPGFYAAVRHPIMTGFLIVFWATPRMTVGHLLFAAAATSYIVLAVRWEERDLRVALGSVYAEYARHTPRFVPAVWRRSRHRSAPAGDRT